MDLEEAIEYGSSFSFIMTIAKFLIINHISIFLAMNCYVIL